MSGRGEIEESFDDLLRKQLKEMRILPWQGMLLVYIEAGMPKWQAMERILREYPESKVVAQGINAEELSSIEHLKGVANRLLYSETGKALTSWLRVQRELGNHIEDDYHWKFESSERALVQIVDTGLRSLAKGNVMNSQAAAATLNAIKELNALYRLTGAKAEDRTPVAAVVFVGESELPA